LGTRKALALSINPDSVAIPPEPLTLSAPLAHRLAGRYCRHVDHSGIGCRGYHGVWQYLRLLELVTTPRDHSSFYVPVLLDAIRSGRRRMLISGAVDYSMLAVVLAACAAAGVAADITIADVCETPIRLCHWYADHIGAAIATDVTDILEHKPRARYDLIITHSFLGAFAPDARARLVSAWYDWLAPGGEVVTVNRIRSGVPQMVTFTDAEIGKFRDSVRHAAAAHASQLDIDAETLDALVQGYLAQRAVYPIGSSAELGLLFEAAGFRIASLALEPLAAAGLPSGPTLRGGAEYAKILAVRA
jgi:hypothetical protein